MKFIIKIIVINVLILISKNVLSQPIACQNIHLNKIDSVGRYNNDSIWINGKLEKRKVDSAFRISIEKGDDPPKVLFYNKGSTEMLCINSKTNDGYWNDYFTVMHFKKKYWQNAFRLENLFFKSDETVCLGVKVEKIESFMGRSPDCILRGKGKVVYKYYCFDTSSIYYLAYKIPSYVESFIFSKGRLVKYGFGNQLAELDEDFFNRRYRVLKGRIYQYDN